MSVFVAEPRVSANTNPRDWAYELGLLPQTASIVFTKSSLIAFLKTHGVEVGPNNAEINKLPRYALIGKMVQGQARNEQEMNAIKPESSSTETQPRKAPSAPAQEAEKLLEPVREMQAKMASQQLQTAPVEVKTPDGANFRPTRRVREPIGGGSAQIGALFGDGNEDHEEAVREAERENSKRRGIAMPEMQSKPVERKVNRPLSSSSSDNLPPSQVSSEGKMDSTGFRPTRRVREPGGTGGTSSITLG